MHRAILFLHEYFIMEENYIKHVCMLQFIQKFLRKLEHFDDTVTWINKEETLFKFPISTYPELDELKVTH